MRKMAIDEADTDDEDDFVSCFDTTVDEVSLEVTVLRVGGSADYSFPPSCSVEEMKAQLSLDAEAHLRFRGAYLDGELPADAKNCEKLLVVVPKAWQRGGVTREEVRAAFKVFDKDNSGTLTFDELVGVFTRPGGGQPTDEAEARAFIAQHDKNGDGVLSIDEFVDAMLALQARPLSHERARRAR